MNNKFLFLLMMLGIIGMNGLIRASGEGMYTEDAEGFDSEYPSLIEQTRRDIEQGDGEVEEYEEEDNTNCEESEYNDMAESPLYHSSRHKHLPWYQRLFEKTLMRLMGIRV